MRADAHFDGVIELGDDLHRIDVAPRTANHHRPEET